MCVVFNMKTCESTNIYVLFNGVKNAIFKEIFSESKFFSIFAITLPDRLMAGPQFLVLVVVVRIHLGQLKKGFTLISGTFFVYSKTTVLLFLVMAP